MSRFVEVSNDNPQIDYSACPLWYRLDKSSQYALETAFRRATDYKRRLTPPDRFPELIEFDAALEMRRVPGEGSQHMRVDA